MSTQTLNRILIALLAAAVILMLAVGGVFGYGFAKNVLFPTPMPTPDVVTIYIDEVSLIITQIRTDAENMIQDMAQEAEILADGGGSMTALIELLSIYIEAASGRYERLQVITPPPSAIGLHHKLTNAIGDYVLILQAYQDTLASFDAIKMAQVNKAFTEIDKNIKIILDEWDQYVSHHQLQ